MDNDRLTNSSNLAIEKKLLSELYIDPACVDRVIDVFSLKKKKEKEN